jgi:hypothetical protein
MKKVELINLIENTVKKVLKEDKNIDGLVLSFGWYVADDSYGKNYRLVLSKTETEGFKNKNEIYPYVSKFVKYLKTNYNTHYYKIKKPIIAKNLQVGNMSEYPNYTYVSLGPSRSEDQFFITINDLK